MSRKNNSTVFAFHSFTRAALDAVCWRSPMVCSQLVAEVFANFGTNLTTYPAMTVRDLRQRM
jgi:hypothetical protein